MGFRAGGATTTRDTLSQEQKLELRKSVVIKGRSERLFTQYRSRSLFLFQPLNPLRKALILTIESKIFEAIVLLVIVVNTGFLAAYDPTQPEDSPRNKFLDQADLVFNGLYTAEMVIKIIAMGFALHPYSYVRDAWNRFDLLIVIIGWATYFLSQLKGASALRAFRVMRTLKTIRGLKGMRLLVVSIINSLPSLGNILVLYFFMFVIFGIAGVQLFSGVMNQRCEASDVTRSPWTMGSWNGTDICDLMETSQEERLCSMNSDAGRQCPEFHTCVDTGTAPNYGITSFNNLPAAMLTLFQCVTLEGWTDIMYQVQDSYSGWVWIYFVVLIVFGAFFVVNLALAVMYGKFTQITEEIEAQTMENKEAKSIHRKSVAEAHRRQSIALATVSAVTAVPGGVLHIPRPGDPGDETTYHMHTRKHGRTSEERPPPSPRADIYSAAAVTPTALHSPRGDGNTTNDPLSPEQTPRSVASTPASTAPMLPAGSRAGQVAITEEPVPATVRFDNDTRARAHGDDHASGQEGKALGPWSDNPLVTTTFAIVNHPGFRTFILLVICANTVTLAIDHNDMSKTLEGNLNIANIVFSSIFILECILKLFGLGIKQYVADRFNIFDFLVVVLSIVEFALLGGGGGGAFSVLRAFRLLRVFKLARSWPNLQHLISVILSSLPLLSHCMMLMMLFVTIFAVVGMQLFGGKMKFEEDGEMVVPRAHFDNFYWACVTVFQVMSGENWNEVMWNGVRATNFLAALYFVIVVLVGSYVILTLVQVVLLNKFSNDDIHGVDALTQRSVTMGAIGGALLTTGKAAASLGGQVVKKSVHVAGQAAKNVTTLARRSPRASSERSRGRTASDQSVSSAQGTEMADMSKRGAAVQHEDKVDRSGDVSDAPSSTFADEGGEDVDPTVPASTTTPPAADVAGAEPEVVQPAADIQLPEDHALVPTTGTVTSGTGSGSHMSRSSLYATPRESDVDSGSDADDESGVQEPTGPARIQIEIAEPVEGTVRAPVAGTVEHDRKWNSVDQVYNDVADEEDDSVYGDAVEEQDRRAVAFQEGPVITSAGAPDEPDGDRRPTDRSLFLFKFDSPFRIFVQRIVFHPLFEGFIIFNILLSSVLLAIEYPGLDQNGGTARFLYGMDFYFLVLFAFEMVMKIVALGFILHKDSYLRGTVWNKLDAFVVMVTFANLILPFDLKFLRALRALRPLRLVGRHSGMKVVVKSLSKSLPAIFQVFLLGLLFWLIFSILGVQFFAGKFYSCTDPTFTTRAECIGTFKPEHCPYLPSNHSVAPEIEPRRWVTAEPNFDNVAHACLALFEVSTLEMWPDIMYNAVDGVDYDHAPEPDHNPLAAMYFVLFLMICAFFVLNLLVGVVIDNFNKVRFKYNGSAFLTKAQRDWVAVQKIMIRYRPVKQYAEPPENKTRKAVFDIVNSDRFEAIISVIIILNMIFLASRHHDQASEWEDALFWSNIIFTGIYVLEAAAKLVGYGIRQYFQNPWNRFDMLIVVLSVMGIAFSFSIGAGVLRSLRVVRVFKLLKSAENLTSLLVALISALPTLSNVGSLLLLVFFVYAVAGVSLFGEVKHGDFITSRANFENFWQALLLLFRMVTGESWNGIMHDAEVQPPDCDNAAGNCGVRFAWLYFVSFEMVAFFVMANLFVAVVLESFADMTNDVALDLSSRHFQQFSRTWSKYDPRTTYYIDPERFDAFLRDLGPPLGIRRDTNSRAAKNVIFNLDIPLYEGQLFYKDVLLALARQKVGSEVTTLPEGKAVKSLERKWSRKYKMPTVPAMYDVSTLIAVKRIQARWRMRARQMAEARRQREREGQEALKVPNRPSTVSKPGRRSVASRLTSGIRRFTDWVRDEDAKNLAQARHQSLQPPEPTHVARSSWGEDRVSGDEETDEVRQRAKTGM